MTAPNGEMFRYTYDADLLTSVIYPNGTMTEYGYDQLNRLVSLETRTITGTPLGAYITSYTKKGQRARVEEHSGRVVEYRYDAAGRLIQETLTEPDGSVRVFSYMYDPVGNRLTKNENGVFLEYTYYICS